MNRLILEIYIEDMYYGKLKSTLGGWGVFPYKEEEIKDEVELRLPYLKGKKYNIVFV